ncbi:clasp N terminal-domain-containing protein, partial [Gorgonomyces haynaldii]
MQRLIKAGDLSIQEKSQILEDLEVDFSQVDPFEYDQFVECFVKTVKAPQFKIASLGLSCLPRIIRSIKQTSPNVSQTLKPWIVYLGSFLVEKLGDAKEKIRETSLECLCLMMDTLLDTKDQLSTNMIQHLERLVISGSLSVKTPKSKESGLEFVLKCHRISGFSLKPYIPQIVKNLEDSNEHIRTRTKETIIQLYNETSNKSMHQDLRKELEKQKVRQTIVDYLTEHFTDEKPREIETEVKGSSAPDPHPIVLDSEKLLEQELQRFLNAFRGKESEENWQEREHALQRLRAIVRGNSMHLDQFYPAMRTCVDHVTKSLLSLRTALVMTACVTLVDMAFFLRDQLDPVVENIVLILIKVCGSSKRLLQTAGLGALRMLISYTGWNPKVAHLFFNFLSDKNQMVRLASIDAFKLFLEQFYPDPSLRSILDKQEIMDLFQKAIKKSLEDAYAQVRETGKDAYYYYNAGWPDRAKALLETCDLPMQKALAKKKEPQPTPINVPVIPDLEEEPKKKPVERKLEKTDSKFEEDFLDLLKSENVQTQIQGLYKLVNAVEESNLKKQSFVVQELATVQDLVLSLYENSMQPEIFDFSYLNILMRGHVLTPLQLLPLLIKMSVKLPSEATNSCLEQFDDHLVNNFTLQQLFAFGFDALVPGKRKTTIRPKKFSEERGLEQECTKKIITWIAQLLSTETFEAFNSTQDYFMQDSVTRMALHTLAPLFTTADEETKACIEAILKAVYGINPSTFKRTLDTVDVDYASEIKQLLQLDEETSQYNDDLDISQIQPDDLVDMTFDEGDDVMDESMPNNFADSSIYVSSRQDLVRPSNGFEATSQSQMVYDPMTFSTQTGYDSITVPQQTLYDQINEQPKTLFDQMNEQQKRMSNGHTNGHHTPREKTHDLIEFSPVQRKTPTSAQNGHKLPEVTPTGSLPLDLSTLDISDPFTARQSPEKSQRVSPEKNHRLSPEKNHRVSPDKNLNRSQDRLLERPAGMAGVINPLNLPEVQQLAHMETPVKNIGRQPLEHTLFIGQTPTPRQPTIRTELEQMPQLLKQLESGQATSSTIRRLFRLSQRYPLYEDDMSDQAIGLWNQWGQPLYQSLLEGLRIEAESHVQENCLLLLKQLLKCQIHYLEGFERDLFKILFECRSEGSGQVFGSHTR